LDIVDGHAFGLQPLEDDDFLRRAGCNRDALALQILDGLDVGFGVGDDAHAAVRGGRDDLDRLAGRSAKQERGDAVDAGIDGAGQHRILAVGRVFEGNDFDLIAGRRELLVEIGGDAMNEFQRAHPQHLVVRVSRRCGRYER
jgi:hypothetical protein